MLGNEGVGNSEMQRIEKGELPEVPARKGVFKYQALETHHASKDDNRLCTPNVGRGTLHDDPSPIKWARE